MTNEQVKAEIMQIYGVLSPSKQQALDMAIKALEQEPKTGHWIDEIISIPLSDGSKECVRCSQCGLHYDVASYYCPNCGCRMVKPQESEE